jgi:hypothetical protein
MIQVVQRMKSAIYCPDECIVRQGTTPKGLFLITRGMVHVLKGPPTEADEGDEGDSSPDRSSCRVSFESDGRSSAGPRARSGAKQVRKSLVGAPGALLGAMGKGQKGQNLVRQGSTFSRLSCRGSVGPTKGRSSKEERDGEEAPPELTVLRQLTDNEFFGEDSLVGRHVASHTSLTSGYITPTH